MNVEVKLRTDDYPGETNWTLINECGANENISMSGGSYSQIRTLYSVTECLPMGQYTFIINDADAGLCCGYGDGAYMILVNGIETAFGGRFT